MRPRPPQPIERFDEQGRPYYPRKNAKNQRHAVCERCHVVLDPGKGRVYWCNPLNGVCDNPEHADNGGPHVVCLDSGACTKRCEKALKAARQKP